MTQPQEKTIALTEDHVCFGGMRLKYSLLVTPENCLPHYRIRACLGIESDEVEVGNDLFKALECYRRVVEGVVTPCTLEEVLKELKYA